MSSQSLSDISIQRISSSQKRRCRVWVLRSWRKRCRFRLWSWRRNWIDQYCSRRCYKIVLRWNSWLALRQVKWMRQSERIETQRRCSIAWRCRYSWWNEVRRWKSYSRLYYDSRCLRTISCITLCEASKWLIDIKTIDFHILERSETWILTRISFEQVSQLSDESSCLWITEESSCDICFIKTQKN